MAVQLNDVPQDVPNPLIVRNPRMREIRKLAPASVEVIFAGLNENDLHVTERTMQRKDRLITRIQYFHSRHRELREAYETLLPNPDDVEAIEAAEEHARELRFAAMAGHLDRVNELLNEELPITQDNLGMAACFALECNNTNVLPDILNALLARRISEKMRGRAVIILTKNFNRPEPLTVLLLGRLFNDGDIYSEDLGRALVNAVSNGNLTLVQLLLGAGEIPTERQLDAVNLATQNHRPDIVDALNNNNTFTYVLK